MSDSDKPAYSGPERRGVNKGPPPGTAERRASRLSWDNRVSAGNLLQMATMVLAAVGAAVTAVFGAGAYVQHLRDDLAVAEEKAAAQSRVQDDKMIELLSKIAEQKR